MSDDGQHGLTIIAFVGSVFSPYYRSARKHGAADPSNHCALNVALYGKAKRWSMTERGKRYVERTPDGFTVGASSMAWQGDELVIRIDEVCAPFPWHLRGEVRLRPHHMYDATMALDSQARHFWRAVAPSATVKASFETPNLSWSGTAYHDMNWGSEPLEQTFRSWSWQRMAQPDGTTVLYDVQRRDGTRLAFGKLFSGGSVQDHDLPPQHALPKGLWRMPRPVLSENVPRLKQVLEDAPFYTRSLVDITLAGRPVTAFHESLSLDRFTNPIVQSLLPYRTVRVG